MLGFQIYYSESLLRREFHTLQNNRLSGFKESGFDNVVMDADLRFCGMCGTEM